MSGAGSPAMSRPSYSIRPEAGAHQPGQRLQQRRLARAVAAEQRHDLAFAHVERRVVEDVALAVEGVDAARSAAPARSRAAVRDAAGDGRRAGAGVDLLHAPVGAHLVGRARHQHLALVHHRDPLREAEHAVDVVLDDQHRDAARPRSSPGSTRARARPPRGPRAARPAAAPAAWSRARCRGRPAAARRRTARRPRSPRCLPGRGSGSARRSRRGPPGSCRCRARH